MAINDKIRRRLRNGGLGQLEIGLESLGQETFSQVPSFRDGEIIFPDRSQPTPTPSLGGFGGLETVRDAPRESGLAVLERPSGERTVSFGAPRIRTIDQPGSERRRGLADISREARIAKDEGAGKIPDKKEIQRLNVTYRDRIKEEQDPEQKRNLAKELAALKIGSTTPFLESKKAAKDYDVGTAVGIFDPNQLRILRQTNKREVAAFAQIRTALANANEADAPAFRREFESRKADLEKLFRSQGKSLEADKARIVKRGELESKLAEERGVRAATAAAEATTAAKERTTAITRKIARDEKLLDDAQDARIQAQVNFGERFDENQRQFGILRGDAKEVRKRVDKATDASIKRRMLDNAANAFKTRQTIVLKEVTTAISDLSDVQANKDVLVEQLKSLYEGGIIENGTVKDGDKKYIARKRGEVTTTGWTNRMQADQIAAKVKSANDEITASQNNLERLKGLSKEIGTAIHQVFFPGETPEQTSVRLQEEAQAARKEAVKQPTDRQGDKGDDAAAKTAWIAERNKNPKTANEDVAKRKAAYNKRFDVQGE